MLKQKVPCEAGKMRNPDTNRCVGINGKIGRALRARGVEVEAGHASQRGTTKALMQAVLGRDYSRGHASQRHKAINMKALAPAKAVPKAVTMLSEADIRDAQTFLNTCHIFHVLVDYVLKRNSFQDSGLVNEDRYKFSLSEPLENLLLDVIGSAAVKGLPKLDQVERDEFMKIIQENKEEQERYNARLEEEVWHVLNILESKVSTDTINKILSGNAVISQYENELLLYTAKVDSVLSKSQLRKNAAVEASNGPEPRLASLRKEVDLGSASPRVKRANAMLREIAEVEAAHAERRRQRQRDDAQRFNELPTQYLSGGGQRFTHTRSARAGRAKTWGTLKAPKVTA